MKGNSLTVKYDDGKSKVFTYDGEDFVSTSGEIIYVDYEDNQYEERWVKGGKYNIDILYYGRKTTTSVSVIETPVKSISLTSTLPLQVINGPDSYTYEDEYGEEHCYYELGQLLYRPANSINITYKNGKTEKAVYDKEAGGYATADGYVYDLEYTYDQEEQWQIGKSYNVSINFMGVKSTVSVKVVPSNVKSIALNTVTPLVFEEYKNGSWVKYDGVDFYYYDVYERVFEKGNSITVTYTDGSKKAFMFDERSSKLTSADGESHWMSYYDSQYSEPFVLGDSNYIYFDFMGIELKVPVKIVPEGTCIKHIESDWIIDIAPTANAAGTQHKECKVCGEVTATGIAPQLKPDMPILAGVSNQPAGVKVTWDAVDGADAYRVYRRQYGTTAWTYLGEVKTNAFIDAKATSGKYWTYTVIAKNEAGFSGFDAVGKTIKYVATPKLTGTVNQYGGIKVSWTAVTGADTYRVYRRVGGATSWTFIGTSKTTSFVDTTATNNLYWIYTVIATSGGVFGGFDVSGKAVKCVSAPKLTGIANVANGIRVNWNVVAGATEYRVYRKLGTGAWAYVGKTTNNYFIDTAVRNMNGYYYGYTVIAMSGAYGSGFDPNGLMTKRLSNPVLTSAVSAKAGITVKWNKVNGCVGYYVYRKTATSGWAYIGKVTGVNNVTYLDKTAVKGVTYTYTVRAVQGSAISSFNSFSG